MMISKLMGCILSTLLLSACFTRETRIILDPDGSGHLEVATKLSHAFLQYAERQAGLPADRIWFHEQALQHAAEAYGEDVRYLDHRIEDTPEAKRFWVRYAFEDVSKLKLQLDLGAPFLLRSPFRLPSGSPPHFTFQHAPGDLHIFPPDLSPSAETSSHVRVESNRVRQQRREQFERERAKIMAAGNPFQISSRTSAEEVLKQLGQTLSVTIHLVISGEFYSGNARFLRHNHETEQTEILLFSLSGQAFTTSSETLQDLVEKGMHAFQWHDLPNLPGIQIETGETVRIRYKTD